MVYVAFWSTASVNEYCWISWSCALVVIPHVLENDVDGWPIPVPNVSSPTLKVTKVAVTYQLGTVTLSWILSPGCNPPVPLATLALIDVLHESKAPAL